MSKFENCIDFVLNHEGGILKDPTTGEYSNFGITDKFLYLIEYFERDPAKLTRTDALNIYHKHIWERHHLSSINSDLCARKIFDMIVNMGYRQASLLVQRAIKFTPEMTDGVMGYWTFCGINEWTEESFLRDIKEECEKFYKGIAKGPKEKYLAGWLKRANDV